MLFIYSDKKIKGKEGNYCSPRFFDVVNLQATKVLTDDDRITKAYKKVNIPTEKITIKRTSKKVM